MKIIDFDNKGNVIRFYLGKDDLENWYGDDWNDRPASCNAGTVYDEFISGIIDVVVPYDYTVVIPENDWHYHGNEPYCKDDYRDGNAPCMIIVPPEVKTNFYDLCYSEQVGNRNNHLVYYGDSVETLEKEKYLILDQKDLTYDEEKRRLYDESGKEFELY